MKLTSSNAEFKMIIIGYYQICGSIIGLLLTLWTLINEPYLSGLSFIMYSLAFILFSFSIYAGNLLSNENIKGISLTRWNQILQILQISISSFSFSYVSGVYFNIGFDWIDIFKFNFDFGFTGWNFRYTESDTNHLSIYINIIPFLILYWLGKIETDIEERKQLMENANEL